ncbi:MAG TPA: tRNA (adenosine(37)-N6)-threonylcarbamoyltransferase complex ATPase subunit type 1 TsaE [Gemmatimonadaceae bacterium]|nr:tRNA (adenosine(37)-N6)-threonylcarbamoyltransferase complex ATPase subunit type 1 TsaE [Gemmatimonadaceae bacterium]
MQPFHHVVPALASRARVAMTRDELVGWGESFGRAARAPLVLALAGDLGAGKTTLAQAICRGYGVTEPVTSPTFALVHRYSAPRSPVYHLDLYRIERPSDLVNIGWDEIAASHSLVIVEWPERAGDLIPVGHVPIDLEHSPTDPDRRVLLAG